MRVTTATVRDMARLGARWRPPRPDATPVTPASIRDKAVTLYHVEGHAAALAYLAGNRDGSKGLTDYYGPNGGGARDGARLSVNFDRYVRYSAADGRDFMEANMPVPAHLGAHELACKADVVVFDPAGYAVRLLNWSQTPVSPNTAQLMAAAALVCVDEHLGADLTTEVDCWDLEHSRRMCVSAATARSRVDDLLGLLDSLSH